MTKEIQSFLKEVLKNIEPEKEQLEKMKSSLKEFKENLKKEIKKLKLDVEIFVGGSFAKKTLIKKEKYDLDLFLRFNKKYKKKNISKLTKRLLKKFKGISMIHGSRDYFRLKEKGFFIEIIPVIKVKSPKESDNITDLSYSHVRYLEKKLKNQKILNEIKIAKAFCHFSNTYGAESYIRGFSGYSLELLVYYYGSFLKFIKAISKNKEEKIIIDIEKYYKRKNVLMDMNSSKLESPIILIDPTYKQRNALAALSKETFDRFKETGIKFLKNPSIKYFQSKKIDLNKIKKQALANKYEFILLNIHTKKQEGDIAGSKLLKFYNHLTKEISKFFEIKKKGFNYEYKKNAKCFFVVKRKKEITIEGPFMKDEENLKKFKRKHKNTFYKSHKIYAKKKINLKIDKFILSWKKNYSKKIKDMDISKIEILKN